MADKNKNHSSSNGKKLEYTTLPYQVTRDVLPQENANQLSGYEVSNTSCLSNTKRTLSNFKVCSFLKNVIPAIEWLPNYKVNKSFAGDVTAGVTVAVMHIPQGMAYGLLAGVSPSVGLYMAFFPTLIYFLMGTSRHISMGTFAVISLMVSKIVTLHSHPINFSAEVNATDGIMIKNLTDEYIYDADIGSYSPIQVVTAVTMVVGIFHILMCFLRLGMLASLLSEPLVNGFTTAAAVHVLVSQMKDLFGIKITRHEGAFKIIYTIQDIFAKIHEANTTAVLISVIVILFMVIMNEFLKPMIAKRCKLPVPSELIAVVGGTAISYLLNLGQNNNVKLVGHIPVGLPTPVAPPLNLLSLVAVDSIAVAIVTYSIVMSMALIFAKKHSYEVRANQELFAIGIANIVGSFFSCIPIACSLSRSLIQDQTGGNTQIASVVSASLILIVLLWVGPFFESLPKCVLAGIIIVALKGMFLQANQLKRFYNEGLVEALVWCVTFFSVILIDIDIGLFLGVGLSIAALYLKGWKSHSCMMGEIPETGIYVDLKHHKSAEEVPKTKIFRYTGSVNFASRSGLKKALYENINVTVKTLRRASMTEESHETTELHGMRVLILDLSCIAHVDPAGCKTFTEIKNEMQILGVIFLLACPSDRVYDAILHATALGEGPFQIFTTIHDAVLFSQGKSTDIV